MNRGKGGQARTQALESLYYSLQIFFSGGCIQVC